MVTDILQRIFDAGPLGLPVSELTPAEYTLIAWLTLPALDDCVVLSADGRAWLGLPADSVEVAR